MRPDNKAQKFCRAEMPQVGNGRFVYRQPRAPSHAQLLVTPSSTRVITSLHLPHGIVLCRWEKF